MRGQGEDGGSRNWASCDYPEAATSGLAGPASQPDRMDGHLARPEPWVRLRHMEHSSLSAFGLVNRNVYERYMSEGIYDGQLMWRASRSSTAWGASTSTRIQSQSNP